MLMAVGNWGSKEALKYVEEFVYRGYGETIISRLRCSQGSAKTMEEIRDGYPYATRVNFKAISTADLVKHCRFHGKHKESNANV